MKVAAVFILMGIVPIDGVAAELPSSVLAAYGITGRWSVACDQPVGPRNPWFSFESRPDGLVDSVGDYGEDGPSRATVREASVDGEHRLHTTSFAAFEGLPKQMRDSLAKSGVQPGITTRSVFTMGSDGGLVTQDVILEIEGLPMPIHTVLDGRMRMANQTSQAPGVPVPTRYRCSP